jgi:surface antigen
VVKVLHTRIGNGQCVSLPKSLGFHITGSAYLWPKNAVLAGYKVGKTPKIGAIAVTKESSYGSYTGHVTGAVQKIENGYVYVQEQNYRRYTITEGWLPISRVVTFIYPKA